MLDQIPRPPGMSDEDFAAEMRACVREAADRDPTFAMLLWFARHPFWWLALCLSAPVAAIVIVYA